MDDVYLLGNSFFRNDMARRSSDQTLKGRDGLNYLSSSETRGSNKNKVAPLRTRHRFKTLLLTLCLATNYLTTMYSSASKAAWSPHI